MIAEWRDRQDLLRGLHFFLGKFGFLDYNEAVLKHGRLPGIHWEAPTYVTELVGY